MTTTRAKIDRALIGTETTENLAMLKLPRGVRHLFTELISWSCDQDTDGAIDRDYLTRITDQPDPEDAMASLVAAGFLEAVDHGWQIIPWWRYGWTSDQKAERRAQSREGMEKLRQGRWSTKGAKGVSANTDANSDTLRTVPYRKGREGTATAGPSSPSGSSASRADDEDVLEEDEETVLDANESAMGVDEYEAYASEPQRKFNGEPQERGRRDSAWVFRRVWAMDAMTPDETAAWKAADKRTRWGDSVTFHEEWLKSHPL